MDPLRNLVIIGVNAALEAGRIALHPPPTNAPNDNGSGHLLVSLVGFPSVVNWSDIGFGELRVSVWWKYDHSKHPQADAIGNSREQFDMTVPLAKRLHYPKFVGVTTSAWLERKTGVHLQGRGKERLFDVYIRRDEKENLAAIPTATPQGYKAEGPFFI